MVMRQLEESFYSLTLFGPFVGPDMKLGRKNIREKKHEPEVFIAGAQDCIFKINVAEPATKSKA